MLDSRAKTKPRIIVISTDADFAQTARAAFNAKIIPGFSLIESALNSPAAERAVCAAAIVVADLGAPEQTDQDLSEFRHLMSRISGDLPVVAVVDTFNDVIARKLVQIKVADILVKPVAPIELLRACTRLAQSKNDDSQIYTFLPVAGGVGTTVLAIQSALTLLGGQAGKDRSTCLVDLNFRHGACADYLDIDARLNLK